MPTDILHRLHQLAGPAIVRQDAGGSPIYWRVKRLSTAEIIDAEAASMAVGGLRVAPAVEPGEEPPPMAVTAGQVAMAAARYQALVCASVDAVSPDGADWTPCRVVPDGQADPDAGTVSIQALDLLTQGRIATAAMQGVREASEWVAPFRP